MAALVELPDEPVLLVSEVAAKLRVHRMTVYRAIRSGALDYVPTGKRIRVPLSAIGRYLAACAPTEAAA